MDCIVNFNDTVKVKLTEKGVSILKEQHEALDRYVRERSGRGLGEYQVPVDEDGYTSFSVWSLMNHFGEYMVLGELEPFKGDMIFIGSRPLEGGLNPQVSIVDELCDIESEETGD